VTGTDSTTIKVFDGNGNPTDVQLTVTVTKSGKVVVSAVYLPLVRRPMEFGKLEFNNVENTQTTYVNRPSYMIINSNGPVYLRIWDTNGDEVVVPGCEIGQDEWCELDNPENKAISIEEGYGVQVRIEPTEHSPYEAEIVWKPAFAENEDLSHSE
jgi:hypothetical protein